MIGEGSSFVIGICTRVRDASAFIEPRAQSVDGEVVDISHSSHNQFPPDGEVELRGGRSMIRVGDWALARPNLDGPPGRRRFVATSSRHLLPFEDLSESYAPESARRLLVETGRQDGFEGEKIFRIAKSEIVHLIMTRGEDGHYRATSTDMKHLPVFAYDESRRHRIPTPSGSIELYEKDPASLQTSVANWSTDLEFLSQVVVAASAEASDRKVSQELAALILARHDEVARVLSEAQTLDPKVGHEILRSRRIADLLKSRSDLVGEFVTIWRADPGIRARLDAEIERLAAVEISARKEQIAGELTEALEREFGAIRQSRQAELEQTFLELEASMLSDLQKRIDAKENDELSNLGIRRLALEKTVSSLEQARDVLTSEHASRTEDVAALSLEAQNLASEIRTRKEDVDRLLKVQSLVEGAQSTSSSSQSFAPGLVEINWDAPELKIAAAPDWIKECPTLTDQGRKTLGRFSSLILSGGVPVLIGGASNEFLDVAASMLSGGRLVVFDCDPTVITFDDLWTRPGGLMPTVLGLALADVRENSTVRLCAIRGADRSAAQFWIETLKYKVARGELPQGLLISVVVLDGRSEGAEPVLKGSVVFQTDDAIDPVQALASLRLKDAPAIGRRINVQEHEPDQAKAASALAMLLVEKVPVRSSDARWFARLYGFAKVLLGDQADSFLRESAKQIGGDDAVGKADLKLVDRGPSNA
jgi:hypothetical protein